MGIDGENFVIEVQAKGVCGEGKVGIKVRRDSSDVFPVALIEKCRPFPLLELGRDHMFSKVFA